MCTVAVQKFDYKDAPKSYQLTSSFRNDERCYEVHVIAGEHYHEVSDVTRKLFQEEDCIDWDTNWDSVSGLWVGITCRDYSDDV